MYVESSSPNYPNKNFGFEAFPAPALTERKLFSFWYHMYGSNMGKPKVLMNPDGNTLNWNQTWSKDGDQGNQWRQAQLELPIGTRGVRIEATVGSNYQSDFAIDDVQVLPMTSSPAPTRPPTGRLTPPPTWRHTQQPTPVPTTTTQPPTTQPPATTQPPRSGCRSRRDDQNWRFTTCCGEETGLQLGW